jgi:hypothetical protein
LYVKITPGFLAFVVLLVVTEPNERTQASSLSSPGAPTAVQENSNNLTKEVRWHSHYDSHRLYGWHRHYVGHRHYGWYRRHWRYW